MAFAFFRKHQKVVMITMVVLMVCFLIPTAFQQLSEGRSRTQTRGVSNAGKITTADTRVAQEGLSILERTGLSDAQFRQMYRQPPMPTDQEFILIHRSQQPALVYALLLAEARKQGLKVSDGEIETFKEQILGPNYAEFLQSLREAGHAAGEKRVAEAFRDWLLITKAAALAAYDVPPSDAELRLTYRDLFERINLRAVTISAEDLAKEIKETPPEAAINEQFMKYRNNLPGQFTDPFEFGFGYRQPPTAGIAYLFISRKALAQAVRPSPEDVQEYYRDHRTEPISISVPAPASAPTATGTSQPATASAPATVEKEILLGSMTLSQARPHLIKLLSDDLVNRKAEELLSRADALESEMKEAPGPSPYEAVLKNMTHPADDKLNAKIHVPILAMPLSQALDMLADDAGLAKIAYPTGTHGKETLNPAVTVTVAPKGNQPLTLGQALEQITKQLRWIQIDRWVTLDTLPNVLLPIPLDKQYNQVFPLTARATPPMTYAEITKDELLGKCVSAREQGVPLARLAFSQFDPQSGRQAIKVGDKGRMYVLGEDNADLGRLAWRLTSLQSDVVPTSLAGDPKLRAKVIEDLKVFEAMNQAEAQARKLVQAAEKDGLEKAAKAAGLKSFDTGLFARKNFSLQYEDVPHLDIPEMRINGQPNTQLREFVINQAFSLVPPRVEPATQGYGAGKAIQFRVPARKEVVLFQRVDYRPAVKGEYESLGPYLGRILTGSQHQASLVRWFDPARVLARLEYKEEGKN